MTLKLDEDTIDEILYLARVNEVEELSTFLEQLMKIGDSKGNTVVAATDEHSGNTALHYAAANGHVETVNYLLSLGEKTILNQTNNAGNTALHWASLNGRLDIVKTLVDAGADVTVINKAGHDAVFEAEINDKKEVVEWLLGAVAALEKALGKGQEAEDEGDSEDITVSTGNVSGAQNSDAIDVEAARNGVKKMTMKSGSSSDNTANPTQAR